MENVYLVGFMGTGKSAVSSELMKLLPCRVVEMDSAIEALACMTIPQIFEKLGENSFRNMETQLLKAISSETNQIVSCGGGVILKQENIDVMKETGTVVRLNATAETIFNRTKKNSNRPLLQKKSVADIAEMINSREEFYVRAADFTVNCDHMTPAEIAAEIVRILAVNGKLV